jgi:hypothetical protein
MQEEIVVPAGSTRRLLGWLDGHLLELAALFLLAFIPLYPKLPLFEPITGYIVLEDVFIGAVFLLWVIYLRRGKVSLREHPLAKPVGLYLAVGFLSTLSALFVTKTVPLSHVHVLKLYLHYFRRVEYFFLTFLFFSVVRDLGVVKRAVAVFGLSVGGVTVYGFGQKYLYWPAFSTMNREFAKGWRLYLTEHARVMSTFGGHYDLAAWLVIVLMTFGALALLTRSGRVKLTSLAIFFSAYLLLLLTASRASFVAYLVATSLLIGLLAARKGVWWATSRWLGLMAVSFVLLFSFGDMAARFGYIVGQGRLSDYLELALLRYQKPKGSVVTTTDEVASVTDQPPQRQRPGERAAGGGQRPPDVYEDIPAEIKEETVLDKNNRPTVVRRVVPREYSTAVRYGLSSAIRFDILWPRAWAGFKRNPLLGSGYSTLTKAKVSDFTEAESTDNDYLRVLGETGLLGFLALALIFAALGRRLKRGMGYLKDPFLLALTAGLAAATVGLLVNGIYIDVLEASKVAEPYWAWTGLVLGALRLVVPPGAVLEARKKKAPWGAVLVGLLLVGGGLVRLYRIDQPLADWHSWRQADTAAVARNYLENGLDLLRPRFDDLSSIPSGKPNPEGYRFVEFPLQGAIIAAAAKMFSTWPLLMWGRLVSIGFSLTAAVLLYLLVRRHSGARLATLSLFFFLFLPFNVYYSRVILPEPLFVAFTLASLYLFDLLIGGWEGDLAGTSSRRAVERLIAGGALLATSLSLLIKPFAVFFWPVFLVRLVQKRSRKSTWVFVFGLLALATAPFLAWRWWAGHFPEGIPAWDWLLNSNGIRLRPAWFRWLFGQRLGELVLGYWGTALLAIGLMRRPRGEESWYGHVWALGGLAYLVVFATGNVTHDYYQVILVPVLAVFLARGVDWLLFETPAGLSRAVVWTLTPLLVVFSLAFSWYYVRDYFNINNPAIVEAGEAVDTLVPPSAKVIAPYGGDTAFLFQTRRKGWPVGGDVAAKIARGAEFYVSVDPDSDEVKSLSQEYLVVEKTDGYVIIQFLPREGEAG